jgi:hypothetical protein
VAGAAFDHIRYHLRSEGHADAARGARLAPRFTRYEAIARWRNLCVVPGVNPPVWFRLRAKPYCAQDASTSIAKGFNAI